MSEKNKIVTYQKIRMLFNTTNPIIVLSLICAIGLLIRVYYFPHNIPITLDGSVYFWYAIDMSLLGDFPHGFDFPNNGWPSFLSLFFAVMKSENFLDFMYMQRLLTMTISTLTAIPIYLLGTRFFEKHYALIGVGIFVLEPRIIINSLLGITEPSFIFIVVLVLFFILGKSIKSTYIAFGLTALVALTRYEGLLLCIPISIVYFLRFGRKKRDVIRYFIALAIFVLILSPMVYERIRTMGDDGLVSHVTYAAKTHQIIAERENLSTSYYGEVFQTTIISFILYLGWIMIPIFAFFVPFTCIVFVRNEFYKIKDSRVITLILFVVTMSLPSLYMHIPEISKKHGISTYFFQFFVCYRFLQ